MAGAARPGQHMGHRTAPARHRPRGYIMDCPLTLGCCSHVGLVLVIPLACGEVGTGSQTGPSDCPQLTRTYLLGVNLESANNLYIHLCRHYPFRNVLTDGCIVRTAAGMLAIVRSYYDMKGRLLCRPPPPPALCCTQLQSPCCRSGVSHQPTSPHPPAQCASSCIQTLG